MTEKVTYTDLLVKVVATALRLHPHPNASWQNGAIVIHEDVNIALAVAAPDGLQVPVIPRADDLSLSGIARHRAEIVERAQTGKLRLTDLQGGTLPSATWECMASTRSTPSSMRPRPRFWRLAPWLTAIPVDGQPAIRPTLTLSLSCDHRVVDGARGAQFLATVAELITDPSGL